MDRNQLIDSFLTEFNQEVSLLNKEIGEKKFADSGSRLTRIRKLVNDSQSFLPAYNSKSVQSILSQAEKDYNNLMVSCRPVKKFSFARNKGNSDKRVTAAAADMVDCATPAPDLLVPDSGPQTSARITQKQDEKIIVKREDLLNQCFVIKYLRNCVIDMKGPANTIHFEQVHGCRITAAPCMTSIRIVSCTDCEFSLSCQQLRIDSTTSSVFHVLTKSGPIIENSSGLRFTAYDHVYPELEQDLTSCSIDPGQDRGRDVQDFNWLSPDQPSPNWSVI